MRTCANPACGKSLEGRRADARFCGPRCRKAAWTGDGPPERLERLRTDTNGSDGGSSAGSSIARPTYGEEDVERALQAMAIASGNSRKANELLKQAGYRAPNHRTLNRWATQLHQERYRELQHEMRDELNARRADTHQALSQAYGDLEWQILERLRDKLPEMKGGELANAANKFSIASAVHTDKARLHRDEPTEIRETQEDPWKVLEGSWPSSGTPFLSRAAPAFKPMSIRSTRWSGLRLPEGEPTTDEGEGPGWRTSPSLSSSHSHQGQWTWTLSER